MGRNQRAFLTTGVSRPLRESAVQGVGSRAGEGVRSAVRGYEQDKDRQTGEWRVETEDKTESDGDDDGGAWHGGAKERCDGMRCDTRCCSAHPIPTLSSACKRQETQRRRVWIWIARPCPLACRLTVSGKSIDRRQRGHQNRHTHTPRCDAFACPLPLSRAYAMQPPPPALKPSQLGFTMPEPARQACFKTARPGALAACPG